MVEREILFAIQWKNRNSNAINLPPESPKCHLIANGGLLFGVREFGLVFARRAGHRGLRLERRGRRVGGLFFLVFLFFCRGVIASDLCGE